jgi:hypothetical protein
MARAAEIVLAAAAVVLLFVLILPWRSEPPPPVPQEAWQAQGRVEKPDPAGSGSTPATLLPLFVDRAAPRPAPRPAVPILDAPWLRYVGFADSGGGPAWYLKDTRTGRVIGVTSRLSREGWCVVEYQNNRLVLRSGDSLYAVSTR